MIAAAQSTAGDVDTWMQQVHAAFEAFPEPLGEMPIWQAAVMIPVGLVSLLYGLKLVKGVVVVYAGLTGVLIGQAVALAFGVHPAIGMAAGGVVLAAIAWPFIRVAVAVFGGIAGGLLAAMIAYSSGLEPAYVVAVAAGGFVGGIALAILVFRPLVIFMTSVIGAVLVTLGVVTVLMMIPAAAEPVAAGIEARRYLLPLVVGVPAVIGALYQAHEAEAEKKPKKKEE